MREFKKLYELKTWEKLKFEFAFKMRFEAHCYHEVNGYVKLMTVCMKLVKWPEAAGGDAA